VLFFLYRRAWALAGWMWPLARLVLGRSGKTARSLAGRREGAASLVAWARSHRDSTRPLVWFHAASVGEGLQAQAVLERLREARPTWQIVYTHTSASAERLAQRLPTDFAGYIPADTMADTVSALEAVRPTALVFSATDLWPELVRQAAQRGVRLGLISATLAPTSSRRSGPARVLLGPAYAALERVGAIDEDDARGLRELGVHAGAITVTGDTRHDAAASRTAALDRRLGVLGELAGDGRPVLVAGSTWAADERELLPAAAELLASRRLRLVIAPHEPKPRYLAALEGRVAAAFGPARALRLSAIELAGAGQAGAWDVCVVDRLGVLAELYGAATIAYVGGGFHDAGLHAVIEPAALAVPVLFGPRWQSSRDARLLLARGGGRAAADRRALAAALREWLENDEARAAAGAAARAVVDAGAGAADRSLQLVIGLVERSA
jgi:3-deoxy-D-manno-octulosonic-acid transferase